MGIFVADIKKYDYPDYEAYAKSSPLQATGENILIVDHGMMDFMVLPVDGYPAGNIGCMVVLNIGPEAAHWAESNHIEVGKTAVLFPGEKKRILSGKNAEWHVYTINYKDVITTAKWDYWEKIKAPAMSKKRLIAHGHLQKDPGLIGKLIHRKK